MSKTMLVCANCGFIAFAARLELEASGWLIEDQRDGTVRVCCPACRADSARSEGIPNKTRTAGSS
jgi:hypothetical protein